MYLRRIVVCCSLAFLSRVPMASGMPARVLTFEDRVGAQEAIERVYYSHQLGATLPFEEAVPRSLLEAKVRSYLRQTIIMESYWHVAVTSRMLERETERIERDTRMPGRLAEIYQALGNDSFLIQECLARPALVERMVGSFYDFDERLHAASRAQAEALRQQLLAGASDEDVPAARRRPIDIRIGPESESETPAGIQPEGQVARLNVPPERFEEIRNGAPDAVGTIGPIVEERDRFVIRSVVSEDSQGFRLMTYAVQKERWEDWWAAVGPGLDELSVRPVASVEYRVHRPLDESLKEQCATDTWTNQSLGIVPDPRQGFTAVWTGSVMVVWGGSMSYTRAVNTGGRYDPATDTWSSTSLVNAPMPRNFHSAVWTGHEMVIWGGSTGIPEAFYTRTGARYDPVADVWTPISTDEAPVGRSGHGAVWTGTEMLVWGGGSNFNGGRYNPATNAWRTIVTPPWMFFRQVPSLTWTGTRLIAWGGSAGNRPYLNTGGAYDPVSDTWTPTSTVNAPAGRIEHVAVWTGSKMVVWGGYDGASRLQSGGRYDPLTDTWISMTTANAPAARSDVTAVVWTGTEMVIWGGYTGSILRTGGRYDPVADVWSATSLVNAPAARFEPQAVWTGDLMIVWGGAQDVTGGRYDPTSDSWTPTSVIGAPEPRTLHTAIWTGSQMVIWGGVGNSAVFNSGGRYDPALDLWEPTSISNAPLARFNHTSVWTGTEMIAWGGQNQFGQDENTGGRYNPMTDSWVPMATAGAPAKRWAHTAVWTGHLMIVFGGRNSQGGGFGTGGRYDPLLDTWTPMRTNLGRYDHSAVWTGKVMLVFGGRTPSSVLADGRGYDPVTDQWSFLYPFNAPGNRSLHEAVWTGRRMLIWGGNPCFGSCSGPYYLGGGSYDPAADRWDPIANAGAPWSRSSSASVWTGKEFLVWGGQDGVPHNDGARYDPVSRTWRSMQQAGAPSERQEHTAVWTGNSMLVWGGSQAFAMLGSGGLYCSCPGPVVDWYQDADGDGYGDQAIFVQSCASPAGFVANAGDCDDNDPSVHPGAAELCNGRDDNCSRDIDEGFGSGETCTQVVDECHVIEGVMRCQNDGSARCEGTSRFQDATQPVIICPQAIEAECPSQPDLGGANATDGCDPAPRVESDAPATLPLGTTTVKWSATDASGNTASCDQTVRIVDTQPPTLMVTTDVHTLWPPNHTMAPVQVDLESHDACDPSIAVSLVAVTSSEPEDTPGDNDGATSQDIADAELGTADVTVSLRAERGGNGPGRTYELIYRASDHSGNWVPATAIVTVPHDQGSAPEPLVLHFVSESGSNHDYIYWAAVPETLAYDVIIGELSQVRVERGLTSLGLVKVASRGNPGTSLTLASDAWQPPVGDGLFYMAQQRTIRGGVGFGTESAALPRVPDACEGGCP